MNKEGYGGVSIHTEPGSVGVGSVRLSEHGFKIESTKNSEGMTHKC